ncbi:MAG: AmmeMemoRadiSam system radical SAM enzyme [Oscillospiraceae bacterium]|jgi:pyruvate formate lyase activating enzyme|nr:AmmeMemoRadiSam system radical SAM enzyme [Oscillospiraceae bacterium]
MSEAREARYWRAVENGAVQCGICPRRCLIAENANGFCGMRENIGAKLIASAYGQVSAVALDPIEKKPLYMFHPGRCILSIGGFGCNFRCPFCQNADISMEYANTLREGRVLSPGDVAAIAARTVPDGNIGIAYTYNEPLINYEFIYDCAEAVHGAGLKNVLVTNGCINKEPLAALLPFIDAMNIDLKAFSDNFYKKINGNLDAVLETITLSRACCHVEITTLVIPGENEGDIAELSEWLSSVDSAIPLHLTRFFPRYKYSDKSPTPRETMYRLQDVAKKHLKNVFIGNM